MGKTCETPSSDCKPRVQILDVNPPPPRRFKSSDQDPSAGARDAGVVDSPSKLLSRKQHVLMEWCWLTARFMLA